MLLSKERISRAGLPRFFQNGSRSLPLYSPIVLIVSTDEPLVLSVGGILTNCNGFTFESIDRYDAHVFFRHRVDRQWFPPKPGQGHLLQPGR